MEPDLDSLLAKMVAQRSISSAWMTTKEALARAVHGLRLESRGSAFFREEEANLVERANLTSSTSWLHPDGSLSLAQTGLGGE